LSNSKGFSMIEALVAASLLMMIITTLIPLTNLLLKEREALQQKRAIINELHHDMQPFLWDKQLDLPHRLLKTVYGSEAKFRFTAEGNLLKGCATWDNANDRPNRFCLYGYTEK